jgi:hypothetical protein
MLYIPPQCRSKEARVFEPVLSCRLESAVFGLLVGEDGGDGEFAVVRVAGSQELRVLGVGEAGRRGRSGRRGRGGGSGKRGGLLNVLCLEQA